MSKKETLYDKIWNSHVVDKIDEDTYLLYIDRHLLHEVTSPQAFAGLRLRSRVVRRPDSCLAVADHGVPTIGQGGKINDAEARLQIETLLKNCSEFSINHFALGDVRQGIVHIIGPEQGFTQPGLTIVCGDSHTSTHGAFGALAFGIGTSEVEHVLSTQTLLQRASRNMLIEVSGALGFCVTAKDVILAIIGKIGTAGGSGSVIEYGGDTIKSLSMSGRMSICNMSIEAGARAGLIAPDEVTYEWLKHRPLSPPAKHWERAVSYWDSLGSDEGAEYDDVVYMDASKIEPQVSWGTSPQDVTDIGGIVPDPSFEKDINRRKSMERALEYMALEAGTRMVDISIERVFIGSCTNSRIEDLRDAALVLDGRKIASNVRAIVVPGSGLVRRQAEKEGLAEIFKSAGFEWREPGCSMCLGMNEDRLAPRERCASTSNRNFEGRQGRGGRTHLLSPRMAAAAAINGRLSDVRELLGG